MCEMAIRLVSVCTTPEAAMTKPVIFSWAAALTDQWMVLLDWEHWSDAPLTAVPTIF